MESSYGSFRPPRTGVDDVESENDSGFEGDQLLGTDSISKAKQAEQTTLDRVRAAFGIALMIFCILVVSLATSSVLSSIGNVRRASSLKEIFTSQDSSVNLMDSVEPLMLSSSNIYGDPKSTMFPYPFLDNALLAEPYKETAFAIENAMSGCAYSWEIVDADGTIVAQAATTDGQWTTSDLETVGEYTLTISESDCDDPLFQRVIGKSIWVKYVRRELSSLTEDDREAFLNALSTLWKVNTVKGTQIYGSKYKSLYYFASIHNDAGANGVCDEFHGDQGFVSNHMMLSAYLEQSLQLVDPSTCLHYLDYSKYFGNATFTDHLSHQLDGGAWTPILSETWFGANDPLTGRIINGRWAEAMVPLVNDEFYYNHGVNPGSYWFPFASEKSIWLSRDYGIHLTNPYGLLRSPWNWNPDPYVMRYNSVNRIPDISDVSEVYSDYYTGVTCKDYELFIESIKGKSLGEFLLNSENNVHGKIHFTFGGQGGDWAHYTNQLLVSKYGFTTEELIMNAMASQTFFKNLYPQYKVKPEQFYGPFPFNCSTFPYNANTRMVDEEAGDPGVDPEISCYVIPYYCESLENIETLMDLYFSLWNKQMPQTRFKTLSLEDQCELMNLLVNRFPFDGEMAGSGAALDPLFWVAHGSVERMLQKVVFANLTSDAEFTSTEDHCSGHEKLGTKYWLTGFFFTNTSVNAHELTNIDINEILNPSTEKYRDLVNFVYDVSDYNWCDGADSWFHL